MTGRQRQVLRLQAYGFSYEEISEQLGLSVWTVKNHHKQAVRSLQISLDALPNMRVRTALACYIIGLLDAGIPPTDIARRLLEARNKFPALTRDRVDQTNASEIRAVAD